MTEQELYEKLDKLHMRTQYARITLLTFKDVPKYEIQGLIQSGSMSVNGSSAVRRTINLSMLATAETGDIENIDNDIAINKKVKVEVGYDNPFREAGDEKIKWFKCGTYVLTSANTSHTTQGYTISITGKDKMCMLDGSVGGTLPATTIFHEKYIEDDNNEITIQYPTLFQIIFEAVNHWGGEEGDKIIISDIDDKVRMLVRYDGNDIIYLDSDYADFQFYKDEHHYIEVDSGEDVGYKLTDFTYPGELILKPGDTVVTLLDKIKGVLGNFEYFYDLDGNFVFQEIKNYLNDGSPLLELEESDYIRSYNNAKYLYNLTDLDTTTQVTRTPKWSDLKNDFYVWGERESAAGAALEIRYHLVVDKKPIPELARMNMWEIKDTASGLIIRYEFTEPGRPAPTAAGYQVTLIATPCTEWREELYRRALVAQVTNSVYDNYYDSEMIAEWRKVYNPMNLDWSDGWNPNVHNDPGALDFWIDFIDSDGPLGKYSISEIGRRTKVVNKKDVKTVYNKEVPDLLFITAEEAQDEEYIASLEALGQKYMQLDEQTYDLFNISSTGASCFDEIREMLYQNLSYNTTIQITCLPKYYMEPNNIIYIRDDASGIVGNYLITQFTLPLAYNGTMSITATEVLTRV